MATIQSIMQTTTSTTTISKCETDQSVKSTKETEIVSGEIELIIPLAPKIKPIQSADVALPPLSLPLSLDASVFSKDLNKRDEPLDTQNQITITRKLNEKLNSINTETFSIKRFLQSSHYLNQNGI